MGVQKLMQPHFNVNNSFLNLTDSQQPPFSANPGDKKVTHIVTMFLILFAIVCLSLLLVVCFVLYLFHVCKRRRTLGKWSLSPSQQAPSIGNSSGPRARGRPEYGPVWQQKRRCFDANGIRLIQPIVLSNPILRNNSDEGDPPPRHRSEIVETENRPESVKHSNSGFSLDTATSKMDFVKDLKQCQKEKETSKAEIS